MASDISEDMSASGHPHQVQITAGRRLDRVTEFGSNIQQNSDETPLHVTLISIDK